MCGMRRAVASQLDRAPWHLPVLARQGAGQLDRRLGIHPEPSLVMIVAKCDLVPLNLMFHSQDFNFKWI